MTTSAPTPYDEVLYPSYTHVQTHPDRLATVALIHGLEAAPAERCRVLELGCGNGSNLIPMACGLPESDFVGIDLAAKPVAAGQEIITGLALNNIRLVQGSITEISRHWGRFDYIIAHGFYSWVPEEVRNHLLTVCQDNLSPRGVAFVSYNAYPGQHLGNMVREMMLFHVRDLAAPRERMRQAQEFVRFLATAQSGSKEYRQFIQAELKAIDEHEDGHLYHDELAEINAPLYFTQFMEHAQRHDLQYLGEADFFETLDWRFSPPVRETLRQFGPDRIRREQYMDFLKCRQFRQTLLCHRDIELRLEPTPEMVPSFLISSTAQCEPGKLDFAPQVTVKFSKPKGVSMETDFALGKAALSVLGETWPRPLGFDELLALAHARLCAASLPQEESGEVRQAFCRFLLQTYGSGVAQFHRHAPVCAPQVSARPTAHPLARWQVGHGQNRVTTAYHQVVKLEDEIGRHLLLLLNGTRDHATLAEKLLHFLSAKNALPLPARNEAEARPLLAVGLERNLVRLARLGLLVA